MLQKLRLHTVVVFHKIPPLSVYCFCYYPAPAQIGGGCYAGSDLPKNSRGEREGSGDAVNLLLGPSSSSSSQSVFYPRTAKGNCIALEGGRRGFANFVPIYMRQKFVHCSFTFLANAYSFLLHQSSCRMSIQEEKGGSGKVVLAATEFIGLDKHPQGRKKRRRKEIERRDKRGGRGEAKLFASDFAFLVVVVGRPYPTFLSWQHQEVKAKEISFFTFAVPFPFFALLLLLRSMNSGGKKQSKPFKERRTEEGRSLPLFCATAPKRERKKGLVDSPMGLIENTARSSQLHLVAFNFVCG